MSQQQNNILSALVNKMGIEKLSIKKLTLLGFSFVALPLVIALIYSASQVNILSQQSNIAIFDVAQLITTNRKLNATLVKMERFASQYIVLNDEELKRQYLIQQQQLDEEIIRHFVQHNDKALRELSYTLAQAILEIHRLINLKNSNEDTEKITLKKLQQQFIPLMETSQAIGLRSHELINLQAKQLKKSANQVSNTILKSLVIIPLTMLIAALFISLITKPLKLLIKRIHSLEQGNFEDKIDIKGSKDVREIVQALEVMRTRLHALELQKSSFIRHISHELKTPLAAIREGSELLYDHSVGQLNDGQQEICDIIRSSGGRLQQLIEDLLAFNIVLDSTSLQDLEALALIPLIDTVLQERSLEIKRKNITIKQNIENVHLQSNSQQLQVILDNLLSNAIKYSPENSCITINGKLENQQLLLQIQDQGPGIAKHLQEKVFDAFYQGPAPDENKIKSSGLGLTIVKELLMRLNGSITINNNHSTNFDTEHKPPSGLNITLILARAFKGKENT